MSAGQDTDRKPVGGTRRGRKLAIWLGAVAAVLVVLVVAVRLLVPTGAVRDLVAARLSASLGRPVTVGEAGVGLLPRPSVELRDVQVAAGTDGMAGGAESLHLRLSWGPLLKREVQIDEAEIVRPWVTVRLADPAAPEADGGTDVAPVPDAPAGSPVTLRIRHLALREGRVTVTRADGTPVVALGGLSEDLSLLATPAGDVVVVGTTKVDSLRLDLPAGSLGQGLGLSWRKDLRWEAAAGRLKVITSELVLGDLPVAVTGEVTGLADGAPAVDLRLAGGPAKLASLQGFLPAGLVPQLDGVQSAGTATLAAMVSGPLGAEADAGSLRWNLHFTLTDGRVEHPDLDSPLRDIALDLAAGPDRLDLTNLAVRTDRSRLVLKGAVTAFLTDPAYDFVVDLDLDLAEAMALQPPRPDAPTVVGHASAQVTVRGQAADPASLRATGPLTLADVNVTGGTMALPVTGLQARGQLDGPRLQLENLSLRQGRSDYRVSGTVIDPLALLPEPPAGPTAVATVDLTVRSSLIDVDEILTAGQAAEATARAAAAGAAAPEAAPAPPAALQYLAKLVGTADVRIDSLVVRGVRLQDVTGTARLDRGRITLDQTTAGVYGGRGSLAGTIDLADPRAGSLDLELAVRDARAEQYFAASTLPGRFTRLASALSGALDATLNLKGALDDTLGLNLQTLTSVGQVALREARLTGLPLQQKLVSLLEAPQLQDLAIRDLLQKFRVEGGRLSVDDLELQAGPVGIRAS
ncbi:MAG: AsmA family protein, partial [Candidatus Krumholzibacteriia bacterium]